MSSTGQDSTSAMLSSAGNVDSVVPDLLSGKDLSFSNFSQVIFPDLSDYFPPGKDIKVTYKLTEAIQPSSRDWVGLFPVGWTTPREYVTFVWAPKSDPKSEDGRTVSVTFTAYYLPSDKNEFYQFCYVTKQGQVRGASTPFQFRNQMECDRLVEVEDESGMIVLKTKTAALEDQIAKVSCEKVFLENKLTELEGEKALIQTELNSVASELEATQKSGGQLKDQCQKLEDEVKELNEKLKKVNSEIKGASKKITKQKQELDGAAFAIAKLTKETLGMKEKFEKVEEAHKEEVSSLVKQLDTTTAKLNECECAVTDLKEKIKTMKMKSNDLQQKSTSMESEMQKVLDTFKKEKNEANSRAQRYKEEKDLFKDQFTQSEETRRDIMLQLTDLKHQMNHKEEEIKLRNEKILAYEEKTKIMKKELKEVTRKAVSEKSAVESQLSNTEDKLNACEASKRLIADELTEARDRRDKLMSELNQAKKDKDRLRRDLESSQRQLGELEKQYLSACERAKRSEQRFAEKEKHLVEEKVRAKEQEKELREQIVILRSQLECADLAVANASAEQDKSDTNTQSTQTYEKKPNNASSQTRNVNEVKEKDRIIDDFKSQVEDLRTRLSMGAAAYTEKYMECHKLEKKMKKIQHKPAPKVVATVQKSSITESTTSDSQDDSAQKKGMSGSKKSRDKKSQAVEAASAADSLVETAEEQTTGGNFMSKLEQLFMAIADPDAEEKEQANQLRLQLQDLEKSVQFQHSKYKKYKQLYMEEKKNRIEENEKVQEELEKVKVEAEQLKTTKEIIKYENEALKEQLREFVEKSQDENVLKTRRSHGLSTPYETSINMRIPAEDKVTDQLGSGSKYPHETAVKPMLQIFYANPYSTKHTQDRETLSSDSEISGEFLPANSGFAALGLCPKNQSSDDSDAIEISRPPIEITPVNSGVINRQPIRSPPLIEIISDETTSDDMSSSPPAVGSGATRKVSKAESSDKSNTGGTRRRRTNKAKKLKAKKNYA